MSDVTRILSQIESGDPKAAEQLLPLVYQELRRLAAAKMAQEKPGQTLQATALVHEAYVRLVDVDQAQHWDSRGHFFAAAAEAMRRVLIDAARRRASQKHGGAHQRVETELDDLATRMTAQELISLDEALNELAAVAPERAKLVTLRYFGGMTIEQAAETLGISRVTAHRYWQFAKAWLHQHLESE
jgi:RNA polymerase sigma factor (TIGR02999 family)